MDDAKHLHLAGSVEDHFERYRAFELFRARFGSVGGLWFPENFDRGFSGRGFGAAGGAGRGGFFGAVAEAGVRYHLSAARAVAGSTAGLGIAKAAEMNGARGYPFGGETAAAA